jgi:hypothetical protein
LCVLIHSRSIDKLICPVLEEISGFDVIFRKFLRISAVNLTNSLVTVSCAYLSILFESRAGRFRPLACPSLEIQAKFYDEISLSLHRVSGRCCASYGLIKINSPTVSAPLSILISVCVILEGVGRLFH